MHDIKVPDDDDEMGAAATGSGGYARVAGSGGNAGAYTGEAGGGGYARASGSGNKEESELEPSDYVKVRFTKFVQLVATHNFEQAMKEHGDEDVIVPTNLLTDLANAHEEAPQENKKKLPLIFLVGIVIGIIVTYIVLRF